MRVVCVRVSVGLHLSRIHHLLIGLGKEGDDLEQEEKTPVVSSTRFDLPPLLRSTVKQSQGRGADPYLSLFLTLAFLGYRLPGGDQF